MILPTSVNFMRFAAPNGPEKSSDKSVIVFGLISHIMCKLSQMEMASKGHVCTIYYGQIIKLKLKKGNIQ